MFRYAKKADFADLIEPDSNTKIYQRLFLDQYLPLFVNPNSRVLEIGSDKNFEQLLSLNVGERWVADPYDGKAGGGSVEIPQVPEGITVAQCTIGVNSDAIPSNYFDLVFSSSVLEHVGQLETKFNCQYVASPPLAQEILRKNLCDEIYRITQPGGINIHCIDHAVRNVTYINNFIESGFDLLLNDPPIVVEEMMVDENAIRQTKDWHNPNQDIPDPELHTVLLLGVKKITEGNSAKYKNISRAHTLAYRLKKFLHKILFASSGESVGDFVQHRKNSFLISR